MENRNISFDILRISACIGVITIHTVGSPIIHHMVSPSTYEYNFCLIMDAMCRWSVPVFAMITGFFMLDSSKELSIKVLFEKYIFRLFFALFFWSLFYSVTLNRPLYPLGSQEGHFWYLGMCIGLYMAMPIMRLIANNTKTLAYFCWIWLTIEVYQFVGNFVTLPINFRDVIFVDYVGYCLFAYYLKTLKLNDWTKSIIYIAGLLCALITIAIGLITQNDDTVFYFYTSPNVIITSIALFLFVLNHPIKLTETISSIIVSTSQCTFGIYLMHLWILIQIFFRLHRVISNALILCPLCVIVVFIFGFGISLFIRKIPYFKKYIV